MRIGVLNGPNLNLLGRREPHHYGTQTLAEIESLLRERAGADDVSLVFFQSNDEGEIVDWVQANTGSVHAWLVNAAALTHTSVALRDALAGSGRPFVEVHLSNVFARESFRHTSLLSDLAIGVIAGFRASSYLFGLDALVGHLRGSVGAGAE
ncbi:MAG: type II 3-dehydroquinate dehydratase [Gemmatimonadales bacterium]|nr:type II 3-dehydroquinate dehydratase [Gemmatimonadales bacterium]MYG49283.1 type II 3-dehydroquinate dehydratase [Gemmatimonadales bacterium]MYK03310.1 type II 3-dehydroquinate dehydratase [Candidatus Palauibacter ramosifaciens]